MSIILRVPGTKGGLHLNVGPLTFLFMLLTVIPMFYMMVLAALLIKYSVLYFIIGCVWTGELLRKRYDKHQAAKRV